MEQYKKDEDDENVTVSDNDMLDAYVSIVKAYRLCNKVYQFAFTYYGLQTFIHILINLELVLELGKWSPEESFYHTMFVKFLSATWNLKNLTLMVVLSIAAESIYITVKIAESTSAEILSYGQATNMRKTCKNVLRLNRAAMHKLSAYGVFELDAAFPLRLLSALVTYTVVLLQFAFL